MRSHTAAAVRFSLDLESLCTTVVIVDEVSARNVPGTNVLYHFGVGTALFEFVTSV
jgi:hypothetical protein